MGLDITVVVSNKHVREGIRPYNNRDFPNHFAGLEEREYSEEGSYHFRAGSYSGFMWFRETLAAMVGVDLETFWKDPDKYDIPFKRFLNYSDCEGSIGPIVCAELAEQFRLNVGNAEIYASTIAHGDRFLESYKEWAKAFQDGINGFVDFH